VKGWIGWVREEGTGRFLVVNKLRGGVAFFDMLEKRFKKEI
jgi:hypothetical protein